MALVPLTSKTQDRIETVQHLVLNDRRSKVHELEETAGIKDGATESILQHT